MQSRDKNTGKSRRTGIGIFQFLLESWERRTQSVRKLEEHFVHNEDGFLT